MGLQFEKIREIDKAVPIIFITATEGYYENFRKQFYPEISKDVNIKSLQKPVGNDELVNIVNKTLSTGDKDWNKKLESKIGFP